MEEDNIQMISKYKSDLEHAIKLNDIQKAYEEEYSRVYNRLKVEYPEDYTHRIDIEHISMWLIAEKTAINRLGNSNSNNHWIDSKML